MQCFICEIFIMFNGWVLVIFTLKPGYIEFCVVCIHLAIGIQLLLTRWVNKSFMDGVGIV